MVKSKVSHKENRRREAGGLRVASGFGRVGGDKVDRELLVAIGIQGAQEQIGVAEFMLRGESQNLVAVEPAGFRNFLGVGRLYNRNRLGGVDENHIRIIDVRAVADVQKLGNGVKVADAITGFFPAFAESASLKVFADLEAAAGQIPLPFVAQNPFLGAVGLFFLDLGLADEKEAGDRDVAVLTGDTLSPFIDDEDAGLEVVPAELDGALGGSGYQVLDELVVLGDWSRCGGGRSVLEFGHDSNPLSMKETKLRGKALKLTLGKMLRQNAGLDARLTLILAQIYVFVKMIEKVRWGGCHTGRF